MVRDPLREQVEREFVVERSGWAPERVGRVTERLQRGVAEGERFETLVVWLDVHTAFTAPGHTIYFSRRLLERLADDDAAAFVVGHELAHHRLGHVPSLSQPLLLLPLGIILALLRRLITSPDHERQADLLAIELCLDAGYDADRCVKVLEHLGEIAFDYGDVDGSLGPDRNALAGGWPWSRRSHPSARERIAAVRAHVDRVRRGERLAVDLTRARERRRRLAAAAAGAAALAVAMILLRRRLPGT